jgi:hypothetical protein
MSVERAKALPRRTPKTITVRDNLPSGAQLVLTPAAAKSFVRLFGDEVMRRIAAERSDAGAG